MQNAIEENALIAKLSPSTQPIIVIGMHRSGTSLIAWALERLGLFMGGRQDANNEALFFQSLNRWALKIAGATWHQPESFDTLLQSEEWRMLVLAYLENHVFSCEIRKYLGWKLWMRYGSVERLDFPWGWKDPRNTYTLPLWLHLFPNAKVIHVRRNGIDVAESLRKRHLEQLQLLNKEQSWSKKNKDALLVAEGYFYAAGLKCASLEGGMALWQKYVSRAQAHTQTLGLRALEVDFESFLLAPQKNLEILASFCGFQYNATLEADLIAQMNTSRAYAYSQSKRLKTFAAEIEAKLPRCREN